MSIKRSGRRVTVKDSDGKTETIIVPPAIIEMTSGKPVMRMKGSKRNEPCPCGSGLKFKHCHGV